MFLLFSSLRRHPRFYICSILVTLVSNSWDAILGSNYVEFLFIWFPIIRIWSYFLPRISRDCLFRFSSLWCHRSFCLCSFLVRLVSKHLDAILHSIGSLLVPLISNHWEVILSSIYGCSFVPFISRHWEPILGSIYAYCMFLRFPIIEKVS